MIELNADARHRDGSAPRYARWSLFDKQQERQAPWCWLDRRTGRLVYQPDHVDPNAAASYAAAPVALR